jgi:hypothetical protein
VAQTKPPRGRLPKGVTALGTSRGGRGYRASIRRGKGESVHLGLYETPWLAAFAYGAAARALGRESGPAVDTPQREQPTAEAVREITLKVRRRLGLEPKPSRREEIPPEAGELAIVFEVAVVGFWRAQAADDDWDEPGAGIDAAAGQLAEAARVLFWRRGPGDPTPLEVLGRLLGRRLDAAFHRADVTREILDDDGDDAWRVARWLVHPEAFVNGRGRGFRQEVRYLYADIFGEPEVGGPGTSPDWAAVLGIGPPYSLEQIRAAYRTRSRTAHPDVGGSNAAFVRLREAYEEAIGYLGSRGV